MCVDKMLSSWRVLAEFLDFGVLHSRSVVIKSSYQLEKQKNFFFVR